MGSVRVNVKLFATLRKYVPDYNPERGVDVRMEEGSTYNDLIETLGLPPNEARLIFVGGISKRPSDQLDNGSEVKVFLPIGGG